MNLLSIELFCLVFEHGSVSEAARRAHLTQPAVTRHIRSLEAYYGVPLFERTESGLIPNAYGKRLYPYLKAIIADHQRAREALKTLLSDGETMPILLGATRTIGEYALPHVIANALAYEARFVFDVYIDNTRSIVDRLKEHRLDVALLEGQVPPEEEADVEAIGFAEDELILVAHPAHPLVRAAAGGALPPAALADAVLIVREIGSGTRELVEQALMERLGGPRPKMIAFNATQAVKTAVEAGLGVAFLSEMSVATDIRAGRLVHLPVEGLVLTRPLYLAMARKRYRPPHVEAFVAWLMSRGAGAFLPRDITVRYGA
ncbi:MAG: LysR family transcriptional regulator [Hydrogenibacillus schlegelii]|uniref:LysR family transcriptional regulator n=1 Tax=Hydrogenibacillus schlegelii TaxID=1484 RepID=A0A947GB29_HYDSH|nr:LysR family transcriptional regulator [Hydrogenibacillus schlegelii]